MPNKTQVVCALLASCFCLISAASAGDVVIRHGKTQVTTTNIKRSIENTIPPKQLGVFFSDKARLSQHAGNLFTVRKLAELAEARELSEDEKWRVEEARMRALSQVQLDYRVAQASAPDFEALALDLYRASPERYQTDESVRVKHLLVSIANRPSVAARQLAMDLRERALAGENFDELVATHSEDPSAAKNGGDLGFFARKAMVKPFEDAAFGMTEAGQISDLVETPFGYHIIKFVERRPAGVRPFEEVKDGIINAERDKFRTRVVNEVIQEIAELDGVVTNYDALMTLHTPFDQLPRSRGQD